ncbi:hypothetical protein D3C73_1354150 [compost metagenome]
MAAGFGQALDQLRHQFRTRQAAITAYGNVRFALGQALRANGAAQPVGGLGIEELRNGATNVIGAENAVRELGYDGGWGVHL